MSQSPPNQTISPKEAKHLLWRKGILHWKLDPNQKSIYDYLKNSTRKIDVVLASRQQGKSTLLCAYAVEFCLQNPESMVKMIAPQVKMIRQILRPIMREILRDCPKDLEPKYSLNDHTFRFPNGSEILIAGTDNGNADSLRGTKSHLCIIDEAGFCDDLDHIIKSILIPTTTATKGRIILSSTPPRSNDHEFCRFWDKAEEEGFLIKRTIYDNPRLTEEDIEMLADAVGGKDSVGWKREYLCQKIVSEDDAVVPEFKAELEERVVKVWPRPSHYDIYAAMDIGFNDFTVVLFAYYDFKNAKLIIEDELVVNGRKLLSDTFAADVIKKESDIWKNPVTGESRKPFLRVSDNNNLIFLNDLQIKHGLTFLTVDKRDSEAALNMMRVYIKNEKVIINPRCKVLISHLKTAIWNKSRSSYQRGADGSHADAIDALKYLCKSVNFNKNPYPIGHQFEKHSEIFFNPTATLDKTFNEQLKRMFQVRKSTRINK